MGEREGAAMSPVKEALAAQPLEQTAPSTQRATTEETAPAECGCSAEDSDVQVTAAAAQELESVRDADVADQSLEPCVEEHAAELESTAIQMLDSEEVGKVFERSSAAEGACAGQPEPSAHETQIETSTSSACGSDLVATDTDATVIDDDIDDDANETKARFEHDHSAHENAREDTSIGVEVAIINQPQAISQEDMCDVAVPTETEQSHVLNVQDVALASADERRDTQEVHSAIPDDRLEHVDATAETVLETESAAHKSHIEEEMGDVRSPEPALDEPDSLLNDVNVDTSGQEEHASLETTVTSAIGEVEVSAEDSSKLGGLEDDSDQLKADVLTSASASASADDEHVAEAQDGESSQSVNDALVTVGCKAIVRDDVQSCRSSPGRQPLSVDKSGEDASTCVNVALGDAAVTEGDPVLLLSSDSSQVSHVGHAAADMPQDPAAASTEISSDSMKDGASDSNLCSASVEEDSASSQMPVSSTQDQAPEQVSEAAPATPVRAAPAGVEAAAEPRSMRDRLAARLWGGLRSRLRAWLPFGRKVSASTPRPRKTPGKTPGSKRRASVGSARRMGAGSARRSSRGARSSLSPVTANAQAGAPVNSSVARHAVGDLPEIASPIEEQSLDAEQIDATDANALPRHCRRLRFSDCAASSRGLEIADEDIADVDEQASFAVNASAIVDEQVSTERAMENEDDASSALASSVVVELSEAKSVEQVEEALPPCCADDDVMQTSGAMLPAPSTPKAAWQDNAASGRDSAGSPVRSPPASPQVMRRCVALRRARAAFARQRAMGASPNGAAAAMLTDIARAHRVRKRRWSEIDIDVCADGDSTLIEDVSKEQHVHPIVDADGSVPACPTGHGGAANSISSSEGDQDSQQKLHDADSLRDIVEKANGDAGHSLGLARASDEDSAVPKEVESANGGSSCADDGHQLSADTQLSATADVCGEGHVALDGAAATEQRADDVEVCAEQPAGSEEVSTTKAAPVADASEADVQPTPCSSEESKKGDNVASGGDEGVPPAAAPAPAPAKRRRVGAAAAAAAAAAPAVSSRPTRLCQHRRAFEPWRNERVVYTRPPGSLCPTVESVVLVQPEGNVDASARTPKRRCQRMRRAVRATVKAEAKAKTEPKTKGKAVASKAPRGEEKAEEEEADKHAEAKATARRSRSASVPTASSTAIVEAKPACKAQAKARTKAKAATKVSTTKAKPKARAGAAPPPSAPAPPVRGEDGALPALKATAAGDSSAADEGAACTPVKRRRAAAAPPSLYELGFAGAAGSALTKASSSTRAPAGSKNDASLWAPAQGGMSLPRARGVLPTNQSGTKLTAASRTPSTSSASSLRIAAAKEAAAEQSSASRATSHASSPSPICDDTRPDAPHQRRRKEHTQQVADKVSKAGGRLCAGKQQQRRKDTPAFAKGAKGKREKAISKKTTPDDEEGVSASFKRGADPSRTGSSEVPKKAMQKSTQLAAAKSSSKAPAKALRSTGSKEASEDSRKLPQTGTEQRSSERKSSQQMARGVSTSARADSPPKKVQAPASSQAAPPKAAKVPSPVGARRPVQSRAAPAAAPAAADAAQTARGAARAVAKKASRPASAAEGDVPTEPPAKRARREAAAGAGHRNPAPAAKEPTTALVPRDAAPTAPFASMSLIAAMEASRQMRLQARPFANMALREEVGDGRRGAGARQQLR